MDARTRKFLNHRINEASGYPRILRMRGKHGDSFWVINSPEEFLGALRAMIEVNHGYGYHAPDEPHLAGALAGVAADVLAFADSRSGAEYEEWYIEDIEPLVLLPEAPEFQVGDDVYLDGVIPCTVKENFEYGTIRVCLGEIGTATLTEEGKKRLTSEKTG